MVHGKPVSPNRPVTLKHAGDFDRAFQRGKRQRSDLLMVITLQREEGVRRVAFLTAKGIGTTARRNRQRRRLREAYRALAPRLTDGPVDILLMALPPASKATFASLKTSLAKLLARAGALDEDDINRRSTP
ncbi:MAG TPA: ribonuclease P protein component [Armatimonadota bacterium]|jgi:ribonuclease P protein component|nr:ribonuclease P protein component [Armatimonadota bacterium]